MRKILLVMLLLMITNPVFSITVDETVPFFDLVRLLSVVQNQPQIVNAQNVQRYAVAKNGGRYYINSIDPRVGVKEIIVDHENGYLCIDDEHQSASDRGYKIELAVFTSMTENIYLVYSCQNLGYYPVSTFFVFKTTASLQKVEEVSSQLMPVITYESLGTFTPSFITDLKTYFNRLNLCYQLPRYGTVVKCRVDTGAWEWRASHCGFAGETPGDCARMKQVCEIFKNTAANRIEFSWSEEKERFEIIKMYHVLCASLITAAFPGDFNDNNPSI